MATNKIGDWTDDWTTNLTSDPLYGAIPTVTVTSGAVYQANTMPNVTIAGGGALPGGYTISGLNGATGSNTIWNTNTTAGSFQIRDSAASLNAGGKMQLHGENADLEINGKSMRVWMERVEERLNILTPNPELEKEWDDLRRLGEKYRKLEKKCKEKADVWNKLKSMPKPEVK
jgi:hypothetical protein